MRKYVANAMWLTIGFAAVMTVAIGALTWNILVWMRTPENIIQGAYNYIFIIFLGIPVTYLYNITASIIRALGDSKTPVYFLVLSSMVNIVMDYITIRYLGMGVAGPAVATVISQAASGILCVAYMKKKFEILHFEPGEMELDKHICMILCNMGIPMGLQYSITAIGSVILQTAVNTLGSVAVASVTAGQKISMFFCCVFDALVGFIGIPLFGYTAVCLASPLAWIFADCFLVPAFRHCIRKLRKLFAEREAAEGK